MIAPLAVSSTSASISLARPKSVTWGWPSASTRIFAGFRSRCRMPRMCAWWTASAVSASRVAATLGLSLNVGELLGEVAALDQFHAEKLLAVVLAHFVNRARCPRDRAGRRPRPRSGIVAARRRRPVLRP